MMDLTGFIDPHVHAAPEHVPRLLDDIALSRQAKNAGMGGILIKSHTTLTADRAQIARKVVPGVGVWGGIALNKCMGGFNPSAVETALAYGAAEIWMPTLDAANHRSFHHLPACDLAIEDHVPDSVHEIIRLIAENDVILGTGHLSVREICLVVNIAREHGVRKILITHPEAPFIAMPNAVQRELAAKACRFERAWVFTTAVLGGAIKPEQIVEEIRRVGVESTILATDMGQTGNPTPVEGLRAYVRALSEAGFSKTEIKRMGALNAREWLPALDDDVAAA